MVDKWELFETKLEELRQEVVKPAVENGHMGQRTKHELVSVRRVLDILKQVEEAEEDFYNTVSGSGG